MLYTCRDWHAELVFFLNKPRQRWRGLRHVQERIHISFFPSLIGLVAFVYEMEKNYGHMHTRPKQLLATIMKNNPRTKSPQPSHLSKEVQSLPFSLPHPPPHPYHLLTPHYIPHLLHRLPQHPMSTTSHFPRLIPIPRSSRRTAP